jgi:hypothetical protein
MVTTMVTILWGLYRGGETADLLCFTFRLLSFAPGVRRRLFRPNSANNGLPTANGCPADGLFSITEVFPDPDMPLPGAIRKLAQETGFVVDRKLDGFTAFTMNLIKPAQV